MFFYSSLKYYTCISVKNKYTQTWKNVECKNNKSHKKRYNENIAETGRGYKLANSSFDRMRCCAELLPKTVNETSSNIFFSQKMSKYFFIFQASFDSHIKINTENRYLSGSKLHSSRKPKNWKN